MTINTLNSIDFSVYVCTSISNLDSKVYTPLFWGDATRSVTLIYPSQTHSTGCFTNSISISWAQWHTPNYQPGQKKTCIRTYIYIKRYISNSPPPPQKKTDRLFFQKISPSQQRFRWTFPKDFTLQVSLLRPPSSFQISSDHSPKPPGLVGFGTPGTPSLAPPRGVLR